MTDQTTTETPATKLMRDLLEGSVRYMGRGPQGPPPADPRAANAMAAHYAGAAARLLHALKESADPAVTRAVASQLDEWLSSGEPLADWVGEKAAECGIDVDALIAVQEELPVQADAPTEPAPELASVILGRALLDRRRDLWLSSGDDWWLEPGRSTGDRRGGRVWTTDQVQLARGPAREVLLVSPAGTRVLEAAQRWRAAARARTGLVGPYNRAVIALDAAVDAMVGDRPTSPSLPPVAQPAAAERDEALREALREDAEVDALRNDEEVVEPVPVPDSGRPTVSRCLNCNGDLVAWKIATALGDVPEGAEAIQGNPEEQAERLIAEGDRLRGALEQSQAHAARWETTAWEWSQKTDAMREELEQLRVNVAGLLMTARRHAREANEKAITAAANEVDVLAEYDGPGGWYAYRAGLHDAATLCLDEEGVHANGLLETARRDAAAAGVLLAKEILPAGVAAHDDLEELADQVRSGQRRIDPAGGA